MMDYAEASGTLLFDVVKETWSDKLFDLFGIPREYFPELAPSDVIMGKVSEAAAQITGIKAGTRLPMAAPIVCQPHWGPA
jgi:xylulokinase